LVAFIADALPLVLHLFEPERLVYVSYTSCPRRILITGFDFVRNIRSDRRCAFLFIYLLVIVVAGYGFQHLWNYSYPGSLGCCLVDRCDSNPSWPSILCLCRMHRTVRPQHHTILLCTHIDVVDCPTPATVKQMAAQNRKPIRFTRTQLSRGIEVAIPEIYERDETPQMNHMARRARSSMSKDSCTENPTGQPRPDENVENGVGCATESAMT